MKRRLLILFIFVCVLININLAANAVSYTVPGTHTTINLAINASNSAGGSNTLSILADQIIASTIANITSDLAISGASRSTTVNFDGTNGFSFSRPAGTYSIADLTITGATNSAIKNSASTGMLTLNNVYLLFNSATESRGGVIYNEGRLDIRGSLFEGNNANTGGAITNYSSNGAITIDGSRFLGNQVTNYGGAIYNYVGTINNITNTEFISNSATSGYAGAIYNNRGATTNIGSNNYFFDNSAIGIGGAIYNSGILNIIAPDGTTVFEANEAAQGGAIENRGTATIDNVSFDSNNATQYGGAIYNDSNAMLSIDNTVFTSNTSGSGGAIYNTDNAMINIDNTVFASNTAGNGGAIYNSLGIITINGSTFDSNVSIGWGGGAIYNLLGSVIYLSSDSVFTSNSGTRGGGIFNGGSVTIGDSAVFNENTGASGGAIYNGGVMTLGNGALFSGNKASANGGAILMDNNSIFNVNNVTFSGNTASIYGGAIYISGQNTLVSLDGAHFELNVAGSDGGAIYNRTGSQINLSSESTFLSNQANNGGAIYNNGGTLTFGDSTVFLENKANASGGAIYNFNSVLSLDDSVGFVRNQAVQNGGAIYNSGPSSIINADSVLFAENSANNGGAIFTDAGTIFNLTSGNSFISNSASGEGGAIQNRGTTIIGGSTLFQENTSVTDGGAVCNYGNITLDSSSGDIIFTGNIAQGLGNDIYNHNNAVININGSANNVIIEDGIAGLGTINKSNDSILVLQGDSSGYQGVFNQTGGTTFVVNGKYFGNGSTSTINSGTFNWLTQDDDKSTGAVLTVNSGVILNVDNNSTLHLASNDTVVPDAILNLYAGSTLNNETSLMFNNDGDIWYGTINNMGNTADVVLDNYSFNNDTSVFTQTMGSLTLRDSSEFTLNTPSSITGGDVNIYSGSVLNMGSDSIMWGVDNLRIDAGTINSINGVINIYSADNLIIGGSGKNYFKIDIDPYNAVSDQYIIKNIIGLDNICVENVGVIGRAPTALTIPINVFVAENIDPVEFSTEVSEVDTAIYRYKFRSDGSGIYTLFRDPSEPNFNPQALRGQVATLAAYQNQLVVNNALFDHVYVDSETYNAFNELRNKYASIGPLFAPYQYHRDEGSVWHKTYGTFEKLFMTHGIDVDNNAYGTIIGTDFNAVQLKKGWKFLPTAYVAYNGARQTYSGVGMYQNGGQGGFMGTFNKGNYIASILGYGGGYFNHMSLPGASEKTGNWFAGAAIKKAYNYRASKHLIIQPTALVSWNIFGNQHWGSDFGVASMVSGFLNGVNVAPGLNMIYGRETWNIYMLAQYIFNINEKISGKVSGVDLPTLKMRHGYTEIGWGVMKTFRERLMTYAQFAFRTGGRRGVGFQIGLMLTI